MKCISENNKDVKFYPPGAFSEIKLNDLSMNTQRFYHFDYKQLDLDEERNHHQKYKIKINRFS